MSRLSTVAIPLSGRRGAGLFAIVDQDDAHLVLGYSWLVDKKGRVYRSQYIGSIEGREITRRVLMHRLVMVAKPGQTIDHKDRNKLNNSKSNLRFCTVAQNNRNMTSIGGVSRFKGVTWDKSCQKWRARIKVNGRNRHLGLFPEEVAAAVAYDQSAREYHAEFAVLNFPD